MRPRSKNMKTPTPLPVKSKKPGERSLTDSSSEGEIDFSKLIQHKDTSSNPIKVDDYSKEKRKREETSQKILGNKYPHLSQMYINGEITLAQLKQNFYALAKNIDYTCYDSLRESLGLGFIKKTENVTRECYKQIKPEAMPRRRRPQSASWNFNAKVIKHYQSSSITSTIFNADSNKPREKSPTKQWNSSIKADLGLITDQCRLIRVTNDRKERPVRLI